VYNAAFGKESAMADLRFCFTRCCHFVNGQPTSQADYELAVQRNCTGLDSPSEALIPCRHLTGECVDVEKSVGFYLGAGLKRMFGTMVADGKMPSVFDSATGAFLRVATADDTKKWRTEWSRIMEAAYKAKQTGA
jgi:hypothetical protein